VSEKTIKNLVETRKRAAPAADHLLGISTVDKQ